MIKAKILLDSIWQGKRLVTMELTYPRFIHTEYMTHRVFSRSSASSRAIPVRKMIEQVKNNPVIPMKWGRAQRGMQAGEEVRNPENCLELWLSARDTAVDHVEGLLSEGLHKQSANRLLEPWMWITVIHSSTEWNNFFKLRCDKAAEPHMEKLALAMREAFFSSQPRKRFWHLPLTGFPDDDKLSIGDLKLVSVARCARVSYLTHAGIRDVKADFDLANMLYDNGHFSPWEHVAHAQEGRWANFDGWKQLRYYVERKEVWPE